MLQKLFLKKIVQKTVEAAEDLIGNKIADKILVWKTKSKEKEDKRQEIYIPPDTTSDNVPRFITKKWIDVHDQSGSAEDRYKPSKQMRFKTSILRSDLCDYYDVYIVLKKDISLTEAANRNFIDAGNRFLAFKNNAPFTNCISKINNVLIYNAEDLDVVMPMYNLTEYNKNYRKTTGSLELLQRWT